jgi:hypothetical protein
MTRAVAGLKGQGIVNWIGISTIGFRSPRIDQHFRSLKGHMLLILHQPITEQYNLIQHGISAFSLYSPHMAGASHCEVQFIRSS